MCELIRWRAFISCGMSPPHTRVTTADEEDEEDGFVVPHGYLSEDEGEGDHVSHAADMGGPGVSAKKVLD